MEMASQYLISVIIPVYNRNAKLQRALKSVLNQSYENIEVVIVDDGSTPSVGSSLSLNDGRVKLITFPTNQGGARARNAGIKQARGEIICFLDSDDFWHENKISDQIKTIEAARIYSKFVVYNRVELLLRNGSRFSPRYALSKFDELDQYITIEKQYMQTSGLMISRDLFSSVAFDETLRKHQDIDIILALKDAGALFLFCDVPNVVFDNTEFTGRVSTSVDEKYTLEFIRKNKNRISKSVLQFYMLSLVAPISFRKNKIEGLRIYAKNMFPLNLYFTKEIIDGFIRYNMPDKFYITSRELFRFITRRGNEN